ncbi:universal stress protein [Actinomycetospora endophytica]|uniref:Universal stress protein n=1 Tax=Actinomycetospora endophytica TaxID=2291215 RepID=A0ABS8PGC9_9PSEU|nr:universal stress protein [Actinomycetospora endophytica]MCD2197325.1 universal stress protein [Actinomycetospora endophytica]
MRRPSSARTRRDELVVGYDGSAGARDALALAVPLAKLWHVDVQVLTVRTPVVLGGSRAAADRELAALRCAETGLAGLTGGVRARCAEQQASKVAAGPHAATVGHAGLLIGRTHRRLRARIRPHHTLFEDARCR